MAKWIQDNMLLQYTVYTLKNAGLNTTQRWVKYGQTHQLGCFDAAVVLNV